MQKRTKTERTGTKPWFVPAVSFFLWFVLILQWKPFLSPSKWAPPTLWANTVILLLRTACLTGTQAKNEEKRNKRFDITSTGYQKSSTVGIGVRDNFATLLHNKILQNTKSVWQNFGKINLQSFAKFLSQN